MSALVENVEIDDPNKPRVPDALGGHAGAAIAQRAEGTLHQLGRHVADSAESPAAQPTMAQRDAQSATDEQLFAELTVGARQAKSKAAPLSIVRGGAGSLVAGGLLVAIGVLVGAFMMRGHNATPVEGAAPVTATANSATSANAGSAHVSAGAAIDRAALTVQLTAPKVVTWAQTFKATGSISAWQEALVGAEVSGLRVAQVLVDIGDQVHRGQALARFDNSTMVAMVEQQRASLVEAKANAAEADANAERAAQLRESGALSEQAIVQYETRARAVRAQVASAQARLRSSELALQYTQVTAPDDGVISSRMAMIGQVANPGAEMFRLVRQNRIEWRAEVPAAQLALIKVGQPAKVQLQDGSTVLGNVRQVSPVLNENTRVGIAYVELDRGNLGASFGKARPGMYASGTITLGEQPALTVPSSAIVQRDGHEFVFTVGAEHHVLQNKVVTGRRIGSDVEVLSGLSAGTRVVQSGAPFLNEGDVVRIAESGT